MKLILIAAAAVAFASTSAFACGTGFYATVAPCLPGAPVPGAPGAYGAPQAWQPTPLPQPQTTYGSIGNQSFSITQWPNGYITIDR
jgi:hypothetical protein